MINMSWKNILKNMQPSETSQGWFYSPDGGGGMTNSNTGFLGRVWNYIADANLFSKGFIDEEGWVDVGLKFIGMPVLFKKEYRDDNHAKVARGMAGKFGITGDADREHSSIIAEINEALHQQQLSKDTHVKEYALSMFDKNAAQNYLNRLKQQVQKPQPKKGIFGRFKR